MAPPGFPVDRDIPVHEVDVAPHQIPVLAAAHAGVEQESELSFMAIGVDRRAERLLLLGSEPVEPGRVFAVALHTRDRIRRHFADADGERVDRTHRRTVAIHGRIAHRSFQMVERLPDPRGREAIGRHVSDEREEIGETLHVRLVRQRSEPVFPHPLIERIHAATKLSTEATIPSLGQSKASGRGGISLPPLVSTSGSFGDVVRARRSALDFRGGGESISFSQLATVLATAQERLFADFAKTRFVHLYLYVHRVEGLTPAVYRYWPEHAELEKIKEGDQRLVAAALSLGQDLAGNACVAFSMIGDFEGAARSYGDRGYRYVHFEAGAIGQRMYLASEALGLRATGIGAFFDERVNRYLDLSPELGQVVYHFAIGYPLPDPRLEA